ncbi:MAG TPA: substrate-binding domain-containing protein [Clostridia bacterium]|nr:substrate-binding domain-containing protein [Clostridia bacterium]
MRKRVLLPALVAVLFTLLTVLAGCGGTTQGDTDEPEVKDVILATTTSTQDSGLLDVLRPMFEEQTGYNLKIVAVGTGAALEMGERGDADVLLVHAPDAEKPLVESGIGINYELVMHNDFVFLGPEDDPIGIKETEGAVNALKRIAETETTFVSRGDDSGTHKKELALWEGAGIDPAGEDWYLEAGQGMSATITIANEMLGYTMSDRGTYLAHTDIVDLQIVSEGDEPLLNIYHVMNVNPDKFEDQKINDTGGKAFVDFLVDPDTQKVISEYGVEDFGMPLFFADRLDG